MQRKQPPMGNITGDEAGASDWCASRWPKGGHKLDVVSSLHGLQEITSDRQTVPKPTLVN